MVTQERFGPRRKVVLIRLCRVQKKRTKPWVGDKITLVRAKVREVLEALVAKLARDAHANGRNHATMRGSHLRAATSRWQAYSWTLE